VAPTFEESVCGGGVSQFLEFFFGEGLLSLLGFVFHVVVIHKPVLLGFLLGVDLGLEGVVAGIIADDFLAGLGEQFAVRVRSGVLRLALGGHVLQIHLVFDGPSLLLGDWFVAPQVVHHLFSLLLNLELTSFLQLIPLAFLCL